MCHRGLSILSIVSLLWSATGLASAIHLASVHDHRTTTHESSSDRNEDHRDAPIERSENCVVCYQLAQSRQAPPIEADSISLAPDEVWHLEATPQAVWPTVACGFEPIIPRAPPAQLT